MISAWTKHLPDQEAKDQFKNSLRGASVVLDRLSDLLKEEENSLDRSELDVRTYDVPNWDYRQADKNGFRRCLRIVQTLLNPDPETK